MKCERCEGEGQVRAETGGDARMAWVSCDDCNGTGLEKMPTKTYLHEFQQLEKQLDDHNRMLVAVCERLQADGMIRVDLTDLIAKISEIRPLTQERAEQEMQEGE